MPLFLQAVNQVTFNDYGSLPTPAVGYRGVVVIVQGITGVADAAWVCLRAADSTYDWVQVG